VSAEVEAQNKLLYLCKRYPTFQAVKTIVEEHPGSVKAVNNKGQTPLHVATAYGASPAVIMYLTLQYPEACSIADHERKLPLHYVSCCSEWLKGDGFDTDFGIFDGIMPQTSGGITTGESDLYEAGYVDMLRVVCRANPEAVHCEDSQGCNPIEYALIEGAPINIVRLLQRASVKNWKEMVKQRRCGVTAQFKIAEQQRNSVAGRSA